MDFQLVRKWCKDLKEENMRLKKELQELTQGPSAFYLDLPKVTFGSMTLTLCPSCGRTRAASSGGKKCSTSRESSVVLMNE